MAMRDIIDDDRSFRGAANGPGDILPAAFPPVQIGESRRPPGGTRILSLSSRRCQGFSLIVIKGLSDPRQRLQSLTSSCDGAGGQRLVSGRHWNPHRQLELCTASAAVARDKREARMETGFRGLLPPPRSKCSYLRWPLLLVLLYSLLLCRIAIPGSDRAPVRHAFPPWTSGCPGSSQRRQRTGGVI